MLAAQVEGILKEKALVPIQNGSVALHEPNVMKIELADIPDGVTIINMRKIGRLSGLRDGEWQKVCDYLVICPTGDADEAIFVELKKTLSEGKRGREQLRRSLPHLDYLRSVCRIEYGSATRAARVPARYVLIGQRVSPSLAKQRVSGGHLVPGEAYHGIEVRRLVGTRFSFSWLAKGEPD